MRLVVAPGLIKKKKFPNIRLHRPYLLFSWKQKCSTGGLAATKFSAMQGSVWSTRREKASKKFTLFEAASLEPEMVKQDNVEPTLHKPPKPAAPAVHTMPATPTNKARATSK